MGYKEHPERELQFVDRTKSYDQMSHVGIDKNTQHSRKLVGDTAVTSEWSVIKM